MTKISYAKKIKMFNAKLRKRNNDVVVMAAKDAIYNIGIEEEVRDRWKGTVIDISEKDKNKIQVNINGKSEYVKVSELLRNLNFSGWGL